MSPGLLASGRPSLPIVSVHIFQLSRICHSRLVVAISLLLMILVIMLGPVAHSGAKKAHDWVVDQIADLFRTTHKVKTQQVATNHGQWCGDIELGGYLANATGPVPLVLDLHIAHDRFGSSSDPNINGHLHYPNDYTYDLDGSLNESSVTKIRQYHTTIIIVHLTVSPLFLLFLVRLGVYIVNWCAFYSYRLIGKLTTFCSFRSSALRNLTVVSSTSTVSPSPQSSSLRSTTFSPRLYHCG
jgi:hypothetical protein